ncbi:MAG: hypothetical protein ACREB3_16875, partial [Burkholderiales bacterium]
AVALQGRLNAIRAGSLQSLGTREQARQRGMSDEQYNQAVLDSQTATDLEAEIKRIEEEVRRARSAP